MKTTRLLTRAGLALVAAALVAGGTMTLVTAFNPQPDPPGDEFSLIGLLDTQSIELTVSNVDVPTGALPPGPCAGALQLIDTAGKVVASQPFQLAAGHSAMLSFSPVRPETNDAAATVQRTYLRGSVSFRKAGGDPLGRSERFCVSGMSIVGANGETSLFTNPGATRLSWQNHNETLVIDTDR